MRAVGLAVGLLYQLDMKVTKYRLLISVKTFVPQKYCPMPFPFTEPKMFCAGPNFLSQPRKLTASSASSKTFVPIQKPILLNANHLLVWHKMFMTAILC